MDFNVTGTLIWYYFICKREVWLMSHQIVPDQDDENMRIGKLIGETSYSRDKKEIEIGNGKFDLMRTEHGELLIGEIKKTSKYEESARNQLLFYLLQLRNMGIKAKGELMFPEEKKKIPVDLDDKAEQYTLKVIEDIHKIVIADNPPPAQKIKFCRKCAYNEFCWA